MDKINTGAAVTFTYDSVEFMFTVINNFCECYANNQYQFGFVLGQSGEIESVNEIVDFLIGNYKDGNIFIEE